MLKVHHNSSRLPRADLNADQPGAGWALAQAMEATPICAPRPLPRPSQRHYRPPVLGAAAPPGSSPRMLIPLTSLSDLGLSTEEGMKERKTRKQPSLSLVNPSSHWPINQFSHPSRHSHHTESLKTPFLPFIHPSIHASIHSIIDSPFCSPTHPPALLSRHLTD